MDADKTCYAHFSADDDTDGMPDDWETDHGLNPAVDDAGGDLDGDGMVNRMEYRYGTDPQDPESFHRIIITPIYELLLE